MELAAHVLPQTRSLHADPGPLHTGLRLPPRETRASGAPATFSSPSPLLPQPSTPRPWRAPSILTPTPGSVPPLPEQLPQVLPSPHPYLQCHHDVMTP